MKGIKNTSELAEQILALELRSKAEWPLLKEELILTGENLNPLKILKKSIQKSVSKPVLQNKLLAGIVGMAAGYASKKMVFGNTHNVVSTLAATLLETEVAIAVSKEPEKIELILNLAKRMFKKNESV
jgi:hypothetical protein